MPNLTISVDAATMRQIKAHPTVNWSEAAREGIRSKLRDLHVWDELLSDSKLSEKDVRELAGKVDASMAKKFQKLL